MSQFLFHEINGYRFDKYIGKGSFSLVFRAVRIRDCQVYAIKVVSKTFLDDERDRQNFQREIDTMTILKHENMVSMIDFFEDRENFFYVLDYCEGPSLRQYLAKLTSITESQAVLYFKQIVSVVAFIHSSGVCHRDLKLDNILFSHYPHIKLTDFGLCQYIKKDVKLETICGTPCYCAPECLNLKKYDGEKADVWSLGVILYEIVSLRHPWDTRNAPKMIQQIRKGKYDPLPRVSGACEDLIRSMLKLNPKERPTAEEILRHPWMRLRGGLQATLSNSSITPVKMDEVSMALTRARSTDEFRQLHSPFKDVDVDELRKNVQKIPIRRNSSVFVTSAVVNMSFSSKGSARYRHRTK